MDLHRKHLINKTEDGEATIACVPSFLDAQKCIRVSREEPDLQASANKYQDCMAGLETSLSVAYSFFFVPLN